MKLLETCSTVFVATLKESLTLHLFLVNSCKIDNKYFASFYVGVSKADAIDIKGGQPLIHFLLTLQEAYINPRLVSTDFRCLCVSSDIFS